MMAEWIASLVERNIITWEWASDRFGINGPGSGGQASSPGFWEGAFIGATLGDFATEDTGWGGIAGQTGAGFIPIAGQIGDVRDTAAAFNNLGDGGWRQGGNWVGVGVAVVGWVPGFDWLKGGRKVLNKLDDVPAGSITPPHGGGGGGPPSGGGGTPVDLPTHTTQFQGLEVRAVRDLGHVDESTLRAMADKGFAPRTVNGYPIVLHHHQQNPNGFIVEMPAPNHSIGNSRQHPFGNTAGAGLTAEQRAAFDTWRVDYWKDRAQQELLKRAGGQ
jgi:hypothetical protein